MEKYIPDNSPFLSVREVAQQLAVSDDTRLPLVRERRAAVVQARQTHGADPSRPIWPPGSSPVRAVAAREARGGRAAACSASLPLMPHPAEVRPTNYALTLTSGSFAATALARKTAQQSLPLGWVGSPTNCRRHRGASETRP